jgi:hypothetical protein
VDCVDVKDAGNTKSGVYKVTPPGEAQIDVYCDMDTEGGGWLVNESVLSISMLKLSNL